METKSLLYGLIGFFIGGLLVSLAATLERPSVHQAGEETSMSQRSEDWRYSVTLPPGRSMH